MFKKRRSFALTEVCVAIILVSIAITYIFGSIRETASTYSILRDTTRSHELADEYLARSIAEMLTTPQDFSVLSAGGESIIYDGPFEIRLQTSCDQHPDMKDKEDQTTIKAPVALLRLTVSAGRKNSLAKPVSRSTLLCVVKEGHETTT